MATRPVFTGRRMNTLISVWLQLALCTALIGFAGVRLSRYGDIIAEKTGLGGSVIGLLLLATVTSLPELITGIGSVALAGAPDIALGNIFGACVLNLAMIVVLDLLHREQSVYTRASHGHILSAAFGVILLGFVGTLFVSLATTLPELTVTVAALRMGAVDMAIGNLFGSNLFNLALVGIDDLFFIHGPLLSHVSPIHAVSALSALMMTGLAIAGLFYRPAGRVLGTVGWISILLLWIFVTNAYFLFRHGG